MGRSAAVVVFSFGINVLLLTAPIYMLQIYDRVMSSRSVESLVYLTAIAVFALTMLAMLELARSRILIGIGIWLERRLAWPTFGASVTRAIGRTGTGADTLRDLATLRGFLTGPAMFPLLDAPWTPIFVVVIFLLHPALGWIALGGAALLLTLAAANDLASRKALGRANFAAQAAFRDADAALRNADVVAAMGMRSNLVARWFAKNAEVLRLYALAGNRTGAITAVSKFIRQGLQISAPRRRRVVRAAKPAHAGRHDRGDDPDGAGTRADGAGDIELAFHGRGASGLPADRPLLGGRRRRNRPPWFFPSRPGCSKSPISPTRIPGPTSPSSEESLSAWSQARVSVWSDRPAAGKSSLSRALVGIITPQSGSVRLDGAELAAWDPEDRGQHIGYLPQDVELFDGTVSENIARMSQRPDEETIAAARLADIHDMVLRLPAGYETQIGAGGCLLSGGQRQRIGLARAVYGEPVLVVLDEPNASLDQMGDESLLGTLGELKKRSVSVVVVAHRPNILRAVDKILVLREGKVEVLGPRDEVLNRITGPKDKVRTRVVGGHGRRAGRTST